MAPKTLRMEAHIRRHSRDQSKAFPQMSRQGKRRKYVLKHNSERVYLANSVFTEYASWRTAHGRDPWIVQSECWIEPSWRVLVWAGRIAAGATECMARQTV